MQLLEPTLDAGSQENKPMKFILSLLLACFSVLCVAQEDSVQSIMMRGIDYHDNGQYDLSLIEYQKAYNLEPKNAFVNYEMALSHYYLGNKTRAEKFAKTASNEASENGLQAIILLGAIYDERGDHKKSIKMYREGIKTFGDYYLLWYNLGVTANTMKDYALAEEAFLKAINNKLDHAGSHYALASIMMLQNRRIEALYPLYFFLMLEADTERSEMAFSDVVRLMQRGVVTKRDENGQLVIELQVQNPDNQDDPMGAGDLFLSMQQAANSNSENAGKSELEHFKTNTKDIFMFMNNQNFGDREDFFTTYYIPFFAEIAESNYYEAFVHYVRQSAYPDSQEWVMKHTDELGDFFDWLDNLEIDQ